MHSNMIVPPEVVAQQAVGAVYFGLQSQHLVYNCPFCVCVCFTSVSLLHNYAISNHIASLNVSLIW